MNDTILFGIKNCDTMKKAFKWLDAASINYKFHDYKKDGVNVDVLKQAVDIHGVDVVINKRGTTWRQLPDATKNGLTLESALILAQENPSILKRPLLIHGGTIHIGFNDAEYQKVFA